jgi:crossover junction endodeoxyribonuclease RuvC
MRVLGIDPGSVVTGFGVIDHEGGRMRHVAAGTIRPSARVHGAERLLLVYRGLLGVIDSYAPTMMSLERGFMAVNIQSAFRLGEARAVAMLAAAERGIALHEYTPTEVKMAVAGFGRADKAQVQTMVRRTLGLDPALALADDASDALALAACHLLRCRLDGLASTHAPGGAGR